MITCAPETVLTAHVLIIDDCFDVHARRAYHAPVWDSHVRDLIPEGKWVCVLNGRVVDQDAPVPPGSRLLFYPYLGDLGSTSNLFKIGSGIFFFPLGIYWAMEAGASATLGAAGVDQQYTDYATMILNPMGAVVGQKLFRPLEAMWNGMPGGDVAMPAGLGSSSESSPTYGFGGIQNDMREGAVLPVVYGTHRVGGSFVSVFVRSGIGGEDITPQGTISVLGWAAVSIKASHDAGAIYYVANVIGNNTNFLATIHTGDIVQTQGLRLRVEAVQNDVSITVFPADDYSIPLHAQTGFFAWTVIRNTPATGNNDVLYAMTALSEGPIEAITSVEINNQPIGNYRQVVVETALGINNQSAPAVFGDSTTDTIAVGAVVSQAFIHYITTRTNITAFEVNLISPALFYQNDQGTLTVKAVTIQVQYKKTTDPTLIIKTVTFLEAKRSPVRKSIRVDFLDPGQYEIHINRLNEESTDPRVQDQFTVSSINEIVNDAYTYPNVAWLATRILATDQLSGGRPTITALVSGRKIRLFTSLTQYVIAWSPNPAWCVLDLLTNMRYGGGQFIGQVRANTGTVTLTNGSSTMTGVGTNWTTRVRRGMKVYIDAHGRIATVRQVVNDTNITLTTGYVGPSASGLAYEIRRDDIDLNSFIDWAGFCATPVSDGAGGMEPRAELNVVLDSTGTALWDTVTKIAAIGFGTVIKAGNRVKVKFHQAEPALQLFTMANIVKGTFIERFMALKSRNNYFEVQFLDAANNYSQAVVSWQDPLIFTNEDSERRSTIQAYGCTKRSHATRLSTFYALTNRYLTRTIEFSAGMEAVVAEPGDVIDFQHDVPQWGFSTRVAPLASGEPSTTAVTLDEPMVVGVGTYQVVIMHGDGTKELRTITDAAGTYSTLHVSVAWTTTPQPDEVIAFGKVNILTKPFRVVMVRRSSDLDVAVTAIEYDARIYDQSQTGTLVPVQYSVLPDPGAPPPHVTDLRVIQLPNANTLHVSFTAPTVISYATSYVYRQRNGAYEKLGESRSGGVDFTGFQYGEMVNITVASVSNRGVISNLLTAPSLTIVIRNQALVQSVGLPPKVTGLELTDQGNNTQFIGKHAKFRWRDRSNTSGAGLELLGYETMGIGAGGTDQAFKDYRVEIYNAAGTIFRRRAFVVDPSFIYTYEMNAEDVGGVLRTFMIRVWQRDQFNRLSELPAELVVSNPPPALPNNLVVRPAFGYAIVQYDPLNELDIAGYKVWLSTTAGFTPDDTTLVYTGSNTFHSFSALANIPVYIKMAAYDTFGQDSLTFSPEFSTTPLGLTSLDLPAGSITETMIADDSIDTPKLRANAVTSDKVTTGNLITLSTQIADAVISSAHIIDLDAGKIRAGSITADKIALTLWGDLSQAIAYASDLLSGQPDFTQLYSNSEVDTGQFVFCKRDPGFTTPVISITTTRKWDDGAGAWWDQGPQGWDEPVTIATASWRTPTFDMLTAKTGKVEFWIEWIRENVATSTVSAKAQYQKDGGLLWGTNYPNYDNGLFETLVSQGIQGGSRTRYVSSINAALRRVRVTMEMQTAVATDRISGIAPEIRFNDTRIQVDKLNIESALTATVGGAGALPGFVQGYLKMQLADGTPIRVPYYLP